MQAMVLAGGLSTRMGQDKSIITLNGRTLLSITIERLLLAGHSRIVVLAADEEQKRIQKRTMDESCNDVEWLLDSIPHGGLIEALVSGVERSHFDQTLPLQLSSVDSPWLNPNIHIALQRELSKDIDVAMPSGNRIHPLHSLVSAPSLLNTVKPDAGPLREQLKSLNSAILHWPESELTNVNVPSDLER